MADIANPDIRVVANPPIRGIHRQDVDSCSVPFDRVWDLAVRGPMVTVGEPPSSPPYHTFAYAPLAVVLEAYRAAGAEVFNVPAVPVPRAREGEG